MQFFSHVFIPCDVVVSAADIDDSGPEASKPELVS